MLTTTPPPCESVLASNLDENWLPGLVARKRKPPHHPGRPPRTIDRKIGEVHVVTLSQDVWVIPESDCSGIRRDRTYGAILPHIQGIFHAKIQTQAVSACFVSR
jgi:hypothetical protein